MILPTKLYKDEWGNVTDKRNPLYTQDEYIMNIELPDDIYQNTMTIFYRNIKANINLKLDDIKPFIERNLKQ